MKNKKIIKILMILIMIFYQLSPAATVLAEEFEEINDNEIIEREPIEGDNQITEEGTTEVDNEIVEEEPVEEDNQTTEEETKDEETTELTEGENQPTEPVDGIVFDWDSDGVLNELYDNVYFQDGYIVTFANGYEGRIDYFDIEYNGESIPTVEELIDSDLTVVVKNGEEEITSGEVKNGYEVEFIDSVSVSATYEVIVFGDSGDDNEFTEDDIKDLMDKYLNKEDVLSMDIFTPGDGEEELGTISLQDISVLDSYLYEIDVTAANEKLSLLLSSDTTELYVGDTVNVDIIVNSDEVLEFINGIEGEISTSNLELTKIEFNDFIGTDDGNGKFVTVGDKISDGQVVITLVLTASSEGVGSVTVSGNIAKGEYVELFDSLTKEFNIIKKASSNADLTSLNASVGEFDKAFDKDITEYTLTVPYDTESVILSGALDDVNASVQGLIEYALEEDATVATIVVTAEDGSTKTYTVTIVKEEEPIQETQEETTYTPESVNYVPISPIVYHYSSNSYLKSLEIDGFDIEFDKDIKEYRITVPSDVTSLDIKALAEYFGSRVEITGNENFKTGENVVLITVTAEDGSNSIYKLIVDKKAPEKKILGEVEDSNKVEKIIIIILIVLVVLGLLYLIFKKDEDDEIDFSMNKENDKKPEVKKVNNSNNSNKQYNKKKK